MYIFTLNIWLFQHFNHVNIGYSAQLYIKPL